MANSNKYPPKFDKNLLYPAEYNLEDLDIPDELTWYNPTSGQQNSIEWGNRQLGEYFNIYFPPNTNSGAPILSYGKHYFLLSFTPTSPNPFNLPKFKAGSRILFEFKDAMDSDGNRRVIFSDLTPYKGLSNYFIGYVWLKQDPLRTYQSLIGGQGILNIVGEVETSNPNWRNKPNLRTSINIDIDLSGTNPSLGTSPLLFQNTTSSISTGVDITEEQGTDNNNPSQSFAIISSSKLNTYGGELKYVNVSCLVSSSAVDGDNEYKPLQIHNMKTGDDLVYENNIHSDYTTGLNPISEKWKVHIPKNLLARGPHDPSEAGTDEYEKIKFRLTYANSANSTAQDLFNSASLDVQVDYPTGSNSWIEWTGSADNTTGISLQMGTIIVGQNIQDGVYITSGEDDDGGKTISYDLYKSGIKQKNVMTVGDTLQTNSTTNKSNKVTSSFMMGSTSASISSSTNSSILGGTGATIDSSDFSTLVGTSGSKIISGSKSSILGGYGHILDVGSQGQNESNVIIGGAVNKITASANNVLIYQNLIMGGSSNNIDVPGSNAALNVSIIGSTNCDSFGGRSNVILASENSSITGSGLSGNVNSSAIIGSVDCSINNNKHSTIIGMQNRTSSADNTVYVQNLVVDNNVAISGSLIVHSITSSIITASVIYSSGSNIFGDGNEDTHTFTGIISVSGSAAGHITASGNISASGYITASGLHISGGGTGGSIHGNFLSIQTGAIINNDGGTSAVQIKGGTDDIMFIANPGGNNNVGIGITPLGSPSAKLQVSGSISVQHDIKAGGNISASGIFYGKQRYYTHHGYNANNTDNTFLPLGLTADNVNNSYFHRWVAPYDGRLVKILSRGEGACDVSSHGFATASNGTEDPVLITNTTIAIDMDTADTTYEFNMSSSTCQFNKGDSLAVMFQAGSAGGFINTTAVWEYEVND